MLILGTLPSRLHTSNLFCPVKTSHQTNRCSMLPDHFCDLNPKAFKITQEDGGSYRRTNWVFDYSVLRQSNDGCKCRKSGFFKLAKRHATSFPFIPQASGGFSSGLVKSAEVWKRMNGIELLELEHSAPAHQKYAETARLSALFGKPAKPDGGSEL